MLVILFAHQQAAEADAREFQQTRTDKLRTQEDRSYRAVEPKTW
jgi:hypothetical protein